MSKMQLSLTADQAYTYYQWLHEVLGQQITSTNLPLKTVMYCAARVYEKLHTKTMIKKEVNMKLSPEQQTSLQHLMLVFPPPAHYTHMAMVLELVKAQLPPVVSSGPYQYMQWLKSGKHLIQTPLNPFHDAE